ncbi:DUF7269 family protein [Natronorubrum halalkaliphilum]|uniref:DUF7269 family protein n=1 Tax=Natronorubrum halalkaliphilum TaxID=2691917 RepID=UPI001F3D16B7|nr:hypothetical protein [Natronorubrum halalkaliphilum]
MTSIRGPRPLGGLVRRLATADQERLAVALVAVGTGLAVAAILLGGFISPGQILVGVLYPLAVLLPVLGLVIAVGALRLSRSRDRSSVPKMVRGPPPETGVTPTRRSVGRETGWTLEYASRGWYQCRTTNSEAKIRDRLTESAVRVCRSRRGLETEAAREAVRAGTWTDDPVAAAFLAVDRRQPIAERVRGAVDPGAAYRRRVRRTLEAIETTEAFEAIETTEAFEVTETTEAFETAEQRRVDR